ncbi:MAG: ribosome biogenesis GTPase Der [bacterium]|nr:ribosome biogenesis GTPase Der [Candidatus Sumerlaeota bacterium]
MKKEIIGRQLPVVAIVGRPNVGKSTLFNRIVGRRKAVVHGTPGLTRDRNYEPAEWSGRAFMLVDTGGYEIAAPETMYDQMREQTMIAIGEANAIVFLADVTETLNPTDDQVMQLLRRTRKPVFVAVNKCDNREQQDLALAEFSRFGAGQVFALSALHGHGSADLLDAVTESLPSCEDDRTAMEHPAEGIAGGAARAPTTRIAVVGRQNVGKSTLVNQILGFERAITSPVAGTTRDAVDTTFERNGKLYTLIDTAGIRRRGKVKPGVEKLSVTASVMSLQRCDVALVVIDAASGLAEQDAHVAGYAVDAGCACIIVVNKWDLVEKDSKTADEFTRMLRGEWGFIKYAPVIYVSAVTGQRVEKLFDMIDGVVVHYSREIATSTLNDFLKRATTHLSPPMRSGRQLKIKYVTQTGARPPTFTFFVNDPKLVHFSYERYLANQLRREFGFEGAPVRLRFREKSEDRHKP